MNENNKYHLMWVDYIEQYIVDRFNIYKENYLGKVGDVAVRSGQVQDICNSVFWIPESIAVSELGIALKIARKNAPVPFYLVGVNVRETAATSKPLTFYRIRLNREQEASFQRGGTIARNQLKWEYEIKHFGTNEDELNDLLSSIEIEMDKIGSEMKY